jgi:hypothetical protein
VLVTTQRANEALVESNADPEKNVHRLTEQDAECCLGRRVPFFLSRILQLARLSQGLNNRWLSLAKGTLVEAHSAECQGENGRGVPPPVHHELLLDRRSSPKHA